MATVRETGKRLTAEMTVRPDVSVPSAEAAGLSPPHERRGLWVTSGPGLPSGPVACSPTAEGSSGQTCLVGRFWDRRDRTEWKGRTTHWALKLSRGKQLAVEGTRQ